MNRINYLLLGGVLCLAINSAFASNSPFSGQDSCQKSGVYLTPEDFKNHKITHQVEDAQPGSSLQLVTQEGLPIVVVTTKGKTRTYRPGTLYGFVQCGQQYRYSAALGPLAPPGYYQLEEAKTLLIYSRRFPEEKGTTTRYFYSLNPKAPLQALTLQNLQKDFKSSEPFLHALQEITDPDGQFLSAKDNEGHFHVNVLLELFTKKQLADAR